MTAQQPKFQVLAQRLRTLEAAALAGIVHSVCLIVSMNMLLATPPITATEEEIEAFYSDPSFEGNAYLALVLLAFGVIGFIWFVAAVRHRIGDREPKFFASVFFGGGLLYAALTFVGASAVAAPSLLVEIGGQIPDPGSAAMARAFGGAILVGVLPRVQALVIFSTASLGRVTGGLPGWLVLLSGLFGLALLVLVAFFTPSVYAFPAWVAIVSLVILIHPPNEPGSEPTG